MQVTNTENDGNGKHRLDDDSKCLVIDKSTPVRLDGMPHCEVWYEVDDDCREHAFDDCQHKHTAIEERVMHSNSVQLWVVE